MRVEHLSSNENSVLAKTETNPCYWNKCCGSFLSLVRFLFSFVLYSLLSITIDKNEVKLRCHSDKIIHGSLNEQASAVIGSH